MEPYLTVEEVAGILKISVQTIRRYVLRKEIPYRKIGRAVRFRQSEIEWWIEHRNELRAFDRQKNHDDCVLFCDLEEAELAEAGLEA